LLVTMTVKPKISVSSDALAVTRVAPRPSSVLRRSNSAASRSLTIDW